MSTTNESAASVTSKKKQKLGPDSGLPGNHGKSKVWEYLTKPNIEGTNKYSGKAKCNYCKLEIDAPSTGGTNKAWNHVKKCRIIPKPAETNQPLISFKEGQPSNWVFNQESCRAALAKMIIIDEQPFSIVEKEGFRMLCGEMQPKFHVVCRTTITKDCIKLYYEEKNKLKAYLKGLPSRVCLTTDMWTSIQNLGYMVLTAHFVDSDWCLQNKIINFRVMPHPHKGEVIAKAIESCLLEWGLEKIMTITLDNARNNNVCAVDLRRRLVKRDALLLRGEFIHVRCFAQVTNLVVKVGIEEVKPTIKRLRRSVKYVRSSPSRLQTFKKCALDENVSCKKCICLDVKTRWNSMYLMIDVALEFENAFDSLREQDANYRNESNKKGESLLLDPDDWKKLKSLHTFLWEFYELTKRVSGSKYVTANTYFDELTQVKDFLLYNMSSSEASFRKMAEKMNEKLDKYCDFESLNQILIVAIVLDPRYKLHYVKFWYDSFLLKVCPELVVDEDGEEQSSKKKIEENEKKVDAFIDKLKDLMSRIYDHINFDTLVDSKPARGQDVGFSSGVDKSKHQKAKDLFRDTLKRKHMVELMDDLERYLADPVIDDEAVHFNVLAWWREKAPTYHALAFMARDVLTIPITSIASECAFSTAGRVLDPFRSSLTPSIVEYLICAQDWLRSPIAIVSTEEKLESLEEIEEIVMNDLRGLELNSAS